MNLLIFNSLFVVLGNAVTKLLLSSHIWNMMEKILILEKREILKQKDAEQINHQRFYVWAIRVF